MCNIFFLNIWQLSIDILLLTHVHMNVSYLKKLSIALYRYLFSVCPSCFGRFIISKCNMNLHQ